MNDDSSSRRYVIKGRVQGVGFRHFVWKMAQELEIQGWVRNLPDGTVEVSAWGPAATLTTVAIRLKQGPRWSRVESVTTVNPVPDSESPPKGFSIRS